MNMTYARTLYNVHVHDIKNHAMHSNMLDMQSKNQVEISRTVFKLETFFQQRALHGYNGNYDSIKFYGGAFGFAFS